MNAAPQPYEGDAVQIETPRIRVLPDGRMTREHAALYLGVKPKTLAMWEMDSKGPASIKVGGRRFYFKEVLDAFIRSDAEADRATSAKWSA